MSCLSLKITRRIVSRRADRFRTSFPKTTWRLPTIVAIAGYLLRVRTHFSTGANVTQGYVCYHQTAVFCFAVQTTRQHVSKSRKSRDDAGNVFPRRHLKCGQSRLKAILNKILTKGLTSGGLSRQSRSGVKSVGGLDVLVTLVAGDKR